MTDKLRKNHVVKFRSGGGHGVVQWLGKQGAEPMALVRWDSSGMLALVEQCLLEVVIIRLGAYDRIGYEPVRSATGRPLVHADGRPVKRATHTKGPTHGR